MEWSSLYELLISFGIVIGISRSGRHERTSFCGLRLLDFLVAHSAVR